MRPGALENGFGFGEPELDANSALTELDKGLRSTKLGEQVESIVRFPALFERYPFPILINSAFLKLADVFRTGSNFLRLWVLRVCQQSERHLDKILNVDEFIRRIFSVIYANDPIARALTLRTLGSLGGLIPEKKKVHHSIRVALDSNDKVEVSAAICAASSFAQKSKTFGTTMCMKIASMVQRLSTPIDLKLRLIPIFQHMHHEVQTASMVRKLCLDLLLNYPSQQFVITILHTLTQLAAATITDLTEQVAFLLTYLEDSRPLVKINVLKDLKFLGEKGGHLWDPNHVSALIDCIVKDNNHTSNNGNNDDDAMEIDHPVDCDLLDAQIVHIAFDVIHSLTSSSAILPFVNAQNSSLRQLLQTNIHSSDIISALKAIQITTDLAINWWGNPTETCCTNLVDMASSGIESLLISLCSQTKEDLAEERFRNEVFLDLEKCLACGVLLTKADMSKCEWLCRILIQLFKLPAIAGRSKNLIVQAIGSIGSIDIESVMKVLPDILTILKRMDSQAINNENCTVATLVGIIFQAHQGQTLTAKTMLTLQSTMKLSNLWLAYRMARNSLRYSQPETAVTAFAAMKSEVCSENFHYWLSALHSIASAEHILSDNKTIPRLIPRINQASNLYLQGVATVKAASSPSSSLLFQIEYLRLRSEMLVAFSNFLVSCNTLQLSPPAEIASTVATVMRDELLKSGRIVTQLRKCIREFQNISELYGKLYQTAFDADNDSLLNIQILQQLCRLVARSIERQVVSRDHPSCSDDDQSIHFFSEMNYVNSGNSWTLILSCKKAINVLQTMKKLPTQMVTYQNIECLRQLVQVIIESPLPYPRFFFQTLQITRVKIAVSPQPRKAGEAVTIMHGNNLALKVEGVIQQNSSNSDDSRPGIKVFRKPKAIRITVISTPLLNPRIHLMDPMKLPQETITLSKDVTPHRDYFQAQFLLLVAAGLTSVTVDTSLVDYEGRVWITGPKAVLSVRVLDETGMSGKPTATSIPGPGPSTRPMNLGGSGPGGSLIMPPRY